ncbi:MAG: membrane protein insertion efficiency factor YidD [bacterium]
MSHRLWSRTLTLVMLLLLASPGQLPAGDRMQGPFSRTRREGVAMDPPTSTVKWISKGAIRLYSVTISPADGPRSPSYPTSTAYGREAIETHGFLVGILLIADRLIHEADVHRGPRIILYGTSRYDDPVKANTYWWDGQLDQE